MDALKTTYPYAASPDVARHQCTECGRWERSDKGPIVHSRSCEAKVQGRTPPGAPVSAPDAGRRFGAQVRATGLTKGRDADVVEAVRAGYLSASDAMNADD